MAWQRVVFNKLYYKWNGVEYEISGSYLPPMVLSSYSELLTRANTDYRLDYTPTWNSWSSSPSSANENYRAIGALDGGSGLNWDYFLGAMSNGQKLYIYKESGNDNMALIFHKYSDAIRLGVKWYGIEQTFSYSIPRMANCTYRAGYEQYAITQRTCNMGFLYNPDTNQYTVYWVGLSGQKGSDIYYMSNFYALFTKPYANDLTGILTYLFTGNVPPQPATDPYDAGGTSTAQTGAATGNFDDTSDTISLPSTPPLNLSLNHFLSAYVPTLTQLNDLADYVWGNYDKTDSSKVLSKILANPQDAIVGLFMLPFTPGSSTAIEVTIGSYGTSVNMAPLTAQFVDVDCGSLTIEEYWGNYLDYNPYTRITLFLPGVGEVQLDPDEVMGVALSVLYRVDCLTGNFVCFVSGDNKIFAQYQGNCALQVPISAADYSRLNQAMLQAALGAVGAVAGVATAGGAVAAAMEGAEAAAGGASTALNIMNSKVNHSHSGTLSGSGFFMGSQKPYVLIHRARQSVPEYANTFYGYPCNVTFTLGDLEGSGFTSIKSIILDGLPYTDGELQELRGILAAGVIL